MKIKNIGTFATVALLTGSLNIVQAEEAKKTAVKKSNRPSREAIVKRFDKDGDGKLNETERKAATAALRKQSGRESDRASESDPRRQRIATARKQISDAMKAGKITEKQANERMAALRKRISQSDRASESDPGRQRIATARKQISDAIKAGEITKKQGKERMEALKKRISQSNRATDRRQGGQGGSERGERSRSRNRDSDRRGNRASDRRQGGRGGENAERRRRGSQPDEGRENRRRGNRRGGE